MVLCVGYLSADRITTSAGAHGPVAGGAALYAALGARAVGATAGVVAAVGQDYPAAWRRDMACAGIDLTFLEQRAGPTRTTDLRYDDALARRSPHFDEAAWLERTDALAPRVPQDLADAAVATVGPVRPHTLGAVLEQGRRRSVRIVADTSAAFLRDAPESVLALLPGLYVFAPSLEETRRLVPEASDDGAAIVLAALGTTVLQKRGAQGAFLVRANERSGTLIAPVPSGRDLDPTGAGDATLGAFAAHLVQGLDIAEAASAAMRIGARTVTAVGPAALGFGASDADRSMARTA